MGKKRRARKTDFARQIQALARPRKGQFKPALDDFANRYTIWLPIHSETDSVFARDQILMLENLFLNCCGEFSQTRDDNGPPWQGVWQSSMGHRIVDFHILIVVYAKYSDESDMFFRRVKKILELPDTASQEIVVIEKQTVQMLAAAPR